MASKSAKLNVGSKRLDAKYGVRVLPPADRPWSIRDFTVDDPTGVLWRIGQSIEAPNKPLQTTHNMHVPEPQR